DNDQATDCNRSGAGSASTGAGILFQNVREVVYRSAIVGDRQSTPTQTNRDAAMNVAILTEEDIVDVGNVPGMYRSSVPVWRYRGKGSGAPTHAAATGSTYLRTDGGAGSTLYVREAGAWVAK